MAISGIGGYGVSGGFYDYTSGINNLKLQQSMQKMGSDFYTNKKLPINSGNMMNSASYSFIKSYNTNMSDLLSASNALRSSNAGSVLNQRTPQSSDGDVASIDNSGRMSSYTPDVELDVKQLAQAQTNTMDPSALSQSAGNAKFTIASQSGSASIDVSRTYANGQKKSDAQFMNDIAKQINGNKSLGVTASVVKDDKGVSSLQLKSTKTGENSTFAVSGDFAEKTGLNAVQTQAQNAVYSAKIGSGSTQEYTSSSNNITLGYSGIKANLKGTGEASIQAQQDPEKVTSAVKDLIKSYNKNLTMLQNNSDRGSGTASQLAQMQRFPISEHSMKLIGMSINKDGTLALDEEKFKKALKEEPEITNQIIGGQSGLAQRAFQSAQSGITRASGSLINNDVQNAQKSTMFNDPISFMNMASKGGAYNMMNMYAVGMMFNALV